MLIPNRIVLAIMASVEDEGTFIRPEEIVFARGELARDTPLLIIDAMMAGVNAGLYMAFMFGIPEKLSLKGEKERFNEELMSETRGQLKAAIDSWRLLDE